jgi:ketosteroid isomerase-like protein
MPAYSRDELESALRHFEATARRASELGDWAVWADLFTEDATYWEHRVRDLGGDPHAVA